MVTGVETAGLVLAGFPLAMNGLGYMIKGVQAADFWRQHRRELKNYSRTLETQRIWYLDTLEQLFDGITEADEEVGELLRDPRRASWWKPQYEKRLRIRLGRSYDQYFDILEHMVETLEDMQEEMGVPTSGTVGLVVHNCQRTMLTSHGKD